MESARCPSSGVAALNGYVLAKRYTSRSQPPDAFCRIATRGGIRLGAAPVRRFTTVRQGSVAPQCGTGDRSGHGPNHAADQRVSTDRAGKGGGVSTNPPPGGSCGASTRSTGQAAYQRLAGISVAHLYRLGEGAEGVFAVGIDGAVEGGGEEAGFERRLGGAETFTSTPLNPGTDVPEPATDAGGGWIGLLPLRHRKNRAGAAAPKIPSDPEGVTSWPPQATFQRAGTTPLPRISPPRRAITCWCSPRFSRLSATPRRKRGPAPSPEACARTIKFPPFPADMKVCGMSAPKFACYARIWWK